MHSFRSEIFTFSLKYYWNRLLQNSWRMDNLSRWQTISFDSTCNIQLSFSDYLTHIKLNVTIDHIIPKHWNMSSRLTRIYTRALHLIKLYTSTQLWEALSHDFNADSAQKPFWSYLDQVFSTSKLPHLCLRILISTDCCFDLLRSSSFLTRTGQRIHGICINFCNVFIFLWNQCFCIKVRTSRLKWTNLNMLKYEN